MTEYRSEFIPRETGIRESYKPDYKALSSGAPLDDETTHKFFHFLFFSLGQRFDSSLRFRHDYIRHSIDKARSFKPEEVYIPRGEFDALTSYNQEYTGSIFFIQNRQTQRIIVI